MGYVTKNEQGDARLTPGEFVGECKCGPSGLPITFVDLTRMGIAIRWFRDFLEEKENTSDKCESGDRTYRAYRTGDAVFLEEIREGGFVNLVGYSSGEIQKVLEEL
jgi:hypothetical protein